MWEYQALSTSVYVLHVSFIVINTGRGFVNALQEKAAFINNMCNTRILFSDILDFFNIQPDMQIFGLKCIFLKHICGYVEVLSFDGWENMLGKGKIVHYEQFLLFPTCI